MATNSNASRPMTLGNMRANGVLSLAAWYLELRMQLTSFRHTPEGQSHGLRDICLGPRPIWADH